MDHYQWKERVEARDEKIEELEAEIEQLEANQKFRYVADDGVPEVFGFYLVKHRDLSVAGTFFVTMAQVGAQDIDSKINGPAEWWMEVPAP